MLTKKSKVDCTAQLAQAKRRIKIIQYNCNNTVAAESEKITLLKPPAIADGPKRGPGKQIDIIEGCPLVCKVDVQGHKAPLRIHIQYETKEQVVAKNAGSTRGQNLNSSYLNSSNAFSQSGGAPLNKSMAKTSSTGFFSKKKGSVSGAAPGPSRPDLRVYVSDVNKEPNENTAI